MNKCEYYDLFSDDFLSLVLMEVNQLVTVYTGTSIHPLLCVLRTLTFLYSDLSPSSSLIWHLCSLDLFATVLRSSSLYSAGSLHLC